MTDLAFFIVTGGRVGELTSSRTHWYNDTGELIIQSRLGDKCTTYGEHLSTGEGHYRGPTGRDIQGFLCWLHALQRFIVAPSGLPQAKTHPNAA